MTDEVTEMINAKGHKVPINLVKPHDLLQDTLVNNLVDRAKDMSKDISDFKTFTFDEVAAFMDTLKEDYGLEKGGKKGNVTLPSYNGLRKVVIAIQETISFGPQLQIAKELIDRCIDDWSDGSSDKIRALVNHAFKVDKVGEVNTAALLSLRQLDIQDETWLKAMEAISESMLTTGSKSYVRYYERKNIEAEWKAVSVNIASAK